MKIAQQGVSLKIQKSMIATLTYTLILAAIYFGIKAIEVIDQED